MDWWLVGWLIDLLINWLVYWLIDYWIFYWLIDWLIDSGDPRRPAVGGKRGKVGYQQETSSNIIYVTRAQLLNQIINYDQNSFRVIIIIQK